MNPPHNQDIRLRFKINAISHSHHISQQEKVHQISILKAAIPQGTDSSGKTIIGIANCMIGSAMIVYPILYAKSGLIISPLVMVIVAFIQYVTCNLLVIHNRPDQPTYNQSILRIGGAKLDKLNSVVNMLLYFFVCVAYFVLISHNFYEVSSAILKEIFPYNPPKSNQIVLTRYSIQWASILTAFLIKPIIFKKQMQFILKLINYAIYCIAAYAIFIFFNLLRHLMEGRIQFSQFRLFNPDFSSVAGAFALSFLVHPTAAPILKRNVNLQNNSRDLMFGYILGVSICFYVGFFGSLSCAPEVENIYSNPNSYSTVFDCITDNGSSDNRVFYIMSKVVQMGILFQNFAVLPIMLFICREQFITLVGKPKLKQLSFNKITWYYLIFSFFIAFMAVDVSVILSLDGAVIGFFMGYGIPIYIHLRCLFHKFSQDEDKKRKSLLESMIGQSILGKNQHELQLQPEALECNKHQTTDKKNTYMVYGCFLLCGIGLCFFKISSIFT